MRGRARQIVLWHSVWLWGALLLPTTLLHANEPISDSDPPATTANEVSSPSIDPELKRQAIQQAFVMLAGIIIGGTLLLLIVVMWGNRTRRFARNPLPTVCKPDELWFLKQKPTLDTERPQQPPPAENRGQS